jgi:hypothetical protein
MLTDNGLAVCAIMVDSISVHKLLSSKMLVKSLTVRSCHRKGRIRPWEWLLATRESVPKRGSEKENPSGPGDQSSRTYLEHNSFESQPEKGSRTQRILVVLLA